MNEYVQLVEQVISRSNRAAAISAAGSVYAAAAALYLIPNSRVDAIVVRLLKISKDVADLIESQELDAPHTSGPPEPPKETIA